MINGWEEARKMGVLYDLYDTYNWDKHLPIEGPILWTYENIYGRDVKCGVFNFIGDSFRVLIETFPCENLKGMNFAIEILDKQQNEWTPKMPHLVNKEASKVIGVIAPEMYALLETEYNDVDFVVFVKPTTGKRVYSWFITELSRMAQFGGINAFPIILPSGVEISIVSNNKISNNDELFKYLNNLHLDVIHGVNL